MTTAAATIIAAKTAVHENIKSSSNRIINSSSHTNSTNIAITAQVSLFTAFWARAAPKQRYLLAFGGGQCSQTHIFTQHLAAHSGLAVNLVEIRLQPRFQAKVSLFTTFWARAAPKQRYLLAFGEASAHKHKYLRNIWLLVLVWL